MPFNYTRDSLRGLGVFPWRTLSAVPPSTVSGFSLFPIIFCRWPLAFRRIIPAAEPRASSQQHGVSAAIRPASMEELSASAPAPGEMAGDSHVHCCDSALMPQTCSVGLPHAVLSAHCPPPFSDGRVVLLRGSVGWREATVECILGHFSRARGLSFSLTVAPALVRLVHADWHGL